MSEIIKDGNEFHGRFIKKVVAFADRPTEPKREDYTDLSDEEFLEVIDDYNVNLAEWETAQKGRTK